MRKMQGRRNRIASLEKAVAQMKELLDHVRQREAGNFESEMVAQIEQLEQKAADARSDWETLRIDSCSKSC
jgi:hypothetical protein